MADERSPRGTRPLTTLEQAAVALALVFVGFGAYGLLRPSPGYVVSPAFRYRRTGREAVTPISAGESQAYGVVMLITGIGIGWAVPGTRKP